jgi:SAM-dependent methyltransferase
VNQKHHYDLMYFKSRPVGVYRCNDWPTNRVQFAVCQAQRGGEALLDIGCGDGDLLLSLKDKYKSYYGIDISDIRLNTAKINCIDLNSNFYNLSIEVQTNLFPFANINTICCLDVLDHLVDVRAAIKNIFNLLADNGRFILTVPNFAKIDRRLKLLMGSFPSTSTKNQGVDRLGESGLFDGGKLHYFTFESLCALLNEAGFNKIERFGIGKFGWVHNIKPSLLSGAICLVCHKG